MDVIGFANVSAVADFAASTGAPVAIFQDFHLDRSLLHRSNVGAERITENESEAMYLNVRDFPNDLSPVDDA